MSKALKTLSVSSEIGTLRRLLVHSPDSGLGKVVPSKAQDWLFEDIVHLRTIRQEYDLYTRLLLYFLDPTKIKGKPITANRHLFKPAHPDFFKSDKVIELQWLLGELLKNKELRQKLIASVAAIEGCPYETQELLARLSPDKLANTFISGTLDNGHMLFPPIPNFIFTRDIGIVINDYLLLNKPAKKARSREALLARYIFFHHHFFAAYRKKIIEIPDAPHHFLLPQDKEESSVTLEGGDIMVIHKHHILVGISERTSMEAAQWIIHTFFEKDIIQKATVIQIPKKREYMHLDTVFTQVKRNTWVVLGALSGKSKKEDPSSPQEHLTITQFNKKKSNHPLHFDTLEALLKEISRTDFGIKGKTTFIYSGNNEFPFDTREQWTDSCNVLALKEGVVLGYDRNDKTIEAFTQHGFQTIEAEDLIDGLEKGTIHTTDLQDTLILMPSAELSRARGGFHCMSMPLLRDEL